MNNDTEVEGRPRPLSTGLWTLFSWLRRDDRSDSSDSLSSAGSDRTVASFAFLTPAHYTPAKVPIVLPPPGPPTDSYKKRVHDRNLRRQYDRDITLHRKYGLFKSGESSCGYDALSLPPARRITSDSNGRWDRDRRATSECYQRRLAHVPGKRRAPLPPVSTTPIALTTSLTRRSTRKRRAPQPPVKQIEKNKENIKNVEVDRIVTQMNPHSLGEKQKQCNNDVTMGCKPEKYSKKEGCKETRAKPEKSFLKQIFDSKKRNSGIDISSVKFLPSISELDKQAAEIIESCKLNASEHNNNVKNLVLDKKLPQSSNRPEPESWICVTCLRKYNSMNTHCLYCLPNQKHSDKTSGIQASNSYTQTEKGVPNAVATDQKIAQEKQKLKEMLKEMKDSLPKRPKHDVNNKTKAALNSGASSYSTETPTLRVGSTVCNEGGAPSRAQPLVTNVLVKSEAPEARPLSQKHLPLTIQHAPVVQIMPEINKNVNINNHIKNDVNLKSKAEVTQVKIVKPPEASPVDISQQYKAKNDLNTPLKISSLLNPVYVPKSVITSKPQMISAIKTEPKTKLVEANPIHATTSKDALAGPSMSHISRLPISVIKAEAKPHTEVEKRSTEPLASAQSQHLPPMPAAEPAGKKDKQLEVNIQVKKTPTPPTQKKDNAQQITLKNTNDQHSRRRDLIHQLEQSIAKGDEGAAAEAAVKLAQLRLSCSVLSFSSQILSQPSTSAAGTRIVPVKEEVLQKESTKKIGENTKKESNAALPNTAIEKAVPKVTSNKSVEKTSSTSTAAPKADPPKDKPLQQKHNEVAQKPVPESKKDNITQINDNLITIAVLVEDREATRGPVHLRVRRQALMRDLRREAETSLGLAINLQRWIIGRVLCVNDDTPIISLAGPDFSAPFYLWVVESETKTEPPPNTKVVEKLINDKSNPETKANVNNNVYTELMQLEQQALVPNAETFECGVCMEEYPPGQGVVLRECVHIFCRGCLSDVVRHCEEPDVPCPAMGCRGMLQEREIRALAIHGGETCEQHRAKIKQAAQVAGKSANPSETDDGTRTLLNSLIAKGEALECPECSAIITKKWGCDWVKCSACKTEICWVTRGRRWGPGGKGDTSGGCRCGVDGKRCHPSCGYCH
ncbi:uncharacterized protein LOC142987553 isoform X2 [Anticarsia gemmatalis]|uniref:uncharacterized protein LOC142987553 isoform X2 n=1 Tax=Anticarsia gemmatalis TaxID=129554 RepID=UPI003F7733AF